MAPQFLPKPLWVVRWGQAGGHHGVSSSAQTLEKELTPLGEELGSKEQSQATGSALQSLKQSWVLLLTLGFAQVGI